MERSVVTASPGDTIRRVAELMKQAGTGFVPVSENGSLVGVITDRDIVLRCLAEGHSDNLDESVAHCMSTDVATVHEDAELEHAAALMEEREIRRLPVVKEGRVVGVLSTVASSRRLEGAGDAATLGVTKGA